MKYIAIVIALFCQWSEAIEISKDDLAKLHRLTTPVIVEDTIYISGPIDSHIYDVLAWAGDRLKGVKKISLNSFGGNHFWALEIARKIQELGLDTVVEEGSYCASACVYLFGSGKNRYAHKSIWFGIHGARLGKGYSVMFWGACFTKIAEGLKFTPQKPECPEFLENWYKTSLEATLDAFASIEKMGVSPELRNHYFQFEDDPAWPGASNILKKPDWELTAKQALDFHLVTQLLDSSTP